MASTECKVTTTRAKISQELINQVYVEDLHHAFDSFFREPNKDANPAMHKWWQKTKDELIEYATDIGINNYKGNIALVGSFWAENREEQIRTQSGKIYKGVSKTRDTLGYKVVGQFNNYMSIALSKTDWIKWNTDSKAYKQVYKAVRRMIKKKRNDFKPGAFSSGIKSSIELSFWGHGEATYEFLREASELDEAARKHYSAEINERMKINNTFISNLRNKFGKLGLNNYIVGDVKDFYIGDKSSENEVRILKINYHKNVDVVEDVDVQYVNRDGDNKIYKMKMSDFHYPPNVNMTESFTKRLINNGIQNFIDDLLAGQTQQWISKGFNKLTSNMDIQEIGEKLRFDKMFKDRADRLNKENKDLGLDANEFTGASPYVKMKIGYYDGKAVEIYYVTTKDSEATMNKDGKGERYEVHIVKHKFKDAGGYPIEYFYKNPDGTWEKNREAIGNALDITKVMGEKSLGKRKQLFEDGFYNAKEQKQFGEIINEQGRSIRDSYAKGWDNFEKMGKDILPNNIIMGEIWNTVHDYRDQNAKFFKAYSDRLEKTTNRYNKVLMKIAQYINSTYPELEIQRRKNQRAREAEYNAQGELSNSTLQKRMEEREQIEFEFSKVVDFLEGLGVKINYYLDGNNKVTFGFERYTAKEENYTQISYDKAERVRMVQDAMELNQRKIDQIDEILDADIDELGEPLKKIPKKNKIELEARKLRYSEKNSFYRSYLEDTSYDDMMGEGVVHGAVGAKVQKHRLPTDETTRNKSAEAKLEKVRDSYKQLEVVNFNASLMETIHTLLLNKEVSKTSDVGEDGRQLLVETKKSAITDVIDNAKMALKDPNVDSTFFGMFPTDYKSIANFFNMMTRSERFTVGNVRWYTQQARAFFTQQFLRTGTALENRTQSYLLVGSYGKAYHNEAVAAITPGKIVRGIPYEQWMEICEIGGAGNLFKIFMDMLASSSSELEFNDGLSYDIGLMMMPHPGNAHNYLKLLNGTKEKFIEGIRKDFRGDLINLGKRNRRRMEKIHKIAKKRTNLSSSAEEEKTFRNLAGLSYDILTLGKNDKNPQTILKLFQQADIEATDAMMKKFMAWSLTYYFDKDLGDLKALMTFSESELRNHRLSYIIALLVADDTGAFGKLEKDGKYVRSVDNQEIKAERFKCDLAIRLGRDAIRNFQFMHGMAGTGKYAWNFGAFLAQMKNFTVGRIKLDLNIRREFLDSREKEGFWEANKDFWKEEWRQTKKMLKTLFRKGQTANQYEAFGTDVAAGKHVYMVNMAILAAMVTMLKYNSVVLLVFGKNNKFMKGVRGFNSPIYSTAAYLVTNSILHAISAAFKSGGDDEDELWKGTKKNGYFLLWNLYRILCPTAIGYGFGIGKKAIVWTADKIVETEKEKMDKLEKQRKKARRGI